jgi:hypothetical protein
MASLATVATPHQFLLCINPSQPACKFLTYPEMVHIAKAAANTKQRMAARGMKETLELKSQPLQMANLSRENQELYTHDPTLHRIFDSTKWNGKRVDPAHLPPPEASETKRPVYTPPLAADELRILVFDLEELSAVYLLAQPGSKDRTVWAVVADDCEERQKRLIETRLKSWSYVAESGIAACFVLSTSAPPEADAAGNEETCNCVYRREYGELLRSTLVKVRSTIREDLGYDDQL